MTDKLASFDELVAVLRVNGVALSRLLSPYVLDLLSAVEQEVRLLAGSEGSEGSEPVGACGRFQPRVNSEREGWDILDTEVLTNLDTDCRDIPEATVIMTVYEPSMVGILIALLNIGSRAEGGCDDAASAEG